MTMTTEMTKTEVHRVLFRLGAEEIRNCEAVFDDESCDDGCYFWSASVLVDGRWYAASVPDHWSDGAEIDWSQSEADEGMS